MLMLRFRDLTIPDGETILRHQAIIGEKKAVWWGWIMRQDETFPNEYIVSLSKRLANDGPQEIILYHSGIREFYLAELTRISALPGGFRIRSPEINLTPPYMHESVCPAWFEIKKIGSLAHKKRLSVQSIPTLKEQSSFDTNLINAPIEASSLRNSGATMWDVEFEK